MEYWLSVTCPSCGEEILYGVCMTLLEYRGRPVIVWDEAAQMSFTCDACGERCHTGEFELFTDAQV